VPEKFDIIVLIIKNQKGLSLLYILKRMCWTNLLFCHYYYYYCYYYFFVIVTINDNYCYHDIITNADGIFCMNWVTHTRCQNI